MESNVTLRDKHSVGDVFLFASKMMKQNWFFKKNAWVIGSFLYKENPNDLDIVSTEPIIFCSKFIAFVQGTFCEHKKSGRYGNIFMDYSTIFFEKQRGPNIDVIGLQEHIDIINEKGLSMMNALMVDLDKVNDDKNILHQAKHVFEVPEIASHLDLQAKNGEAERRWVIQQIEKKSYCEWWGMREKDKKAFKNWTVLDGSLCEKHGMFKTKYKN